MQNPHTDRFTSESDPLPLSSTLVLFFLYIILLVGIEAHARWLFSGRCFAER